MSGLNPRQARFVEEYIVDLNGKQAAIRAGYAPGSAEVHASRLLTDAKVAAAVAQAVLERSKRLEIDQDRVLRELAKIGFTDLSDVVSWGTKEVAIGYDEDGVQLPPAQLGDAVMVRQELAPYVEAVPSDRLTAAARGAVSEVALTKDGLKIKMHDKVGALRDIGRHLGMFKDKLEHSGSISFEQFVADSYGGKE